MKFLSNLFGKRKVTLEDAKVMQRQVDREMKLYKARLNKLQAERNQLFDQAVEARKKGDDMECRYLFQDIKHKDQEAKLLERDLLTMNKERSVFLGIMHQLKRAARQKDSRGTVNFLEKVRASGIMHDIDRAEVNLEAFEANLGEFMDTLDAGMEDVRMETTDSSEYNSFMETLDSVLDQGDDLTRDERAEKYKEFSSEQKEDPDPLRDI